MMIPPAIFSGVFIVALIASGTWRGYLEKRLDQNKRMQAGIYWKAFKGGTLGSAGVS